MLVQDNVLRTQVIINTWVNHAIPMRKRGQAFNN